MPWRSNGVNMVDTMTIRLPDGMRDELHILSKANNRSMNGQVVEELRKAIKRSKSPSRPKPIHSGER